MWTDVELLSIRRNLEGGRNSGRDEGVKGWRNENKQEEEED